MTEKPKLDYDWRLLANAQVSDSYIKQGKAGAEHLTKSLELILRDMDKYDPCIAATLSDPSVAPKLVKNMLDTYSQYKSNQTLGDLLTPYEKDLKEYFNDNFNAYQADLNSLKDETYASVMESIGRAQYILKGRKEYNLFSDNEVKNAEKTLEKYKKITQALDEITDKESLKFQLRVAEETRKDSLGSLYAPDDESVRAA